MKVIAFKSNRAIIASMTVSELINLSGFNFGSDFDRNP